MTLSNIIGKLQERADSQAEWLAEYAPYCLAEQKQLDEGTPERAYWHYGYRTALLDAVKLLEALTP